MAADRIEWRKKTDAKDMASLRDNFSCQGNKKGLVLHFTCEVVSECAWLCYFLLSGVTTAYRQRAPLTLSQGFTLRFIFLWSLWISIGREIVESCSSLCFEIVVFVKWLCNLVSGFVNSCENYLSQVSSQMMGLEIFSIWTWQLLDIIYKFYVIK